LCAPYQAAIALISSSEKPFAMVQPLNRPGDDRDVPHSNFIADETGRV
jgi:hypothetical protein